MFIYEYDFLSFLYSLFTIVYFLNISLLLFRLFNLGIRLLQRQTFINDPSSSVKVLMGENPVNDDLPIATTPSKADLETVLDVMNIQMKFWPSLASSYRLLQITLRVGNTSD